MLVMSGSGRQCEQLDFAKRDHVGQLRRLIWMLMVWATFMTLGLAASLSLHFIHSQTPANVTGVAPKAPVNSLPVLLPFDYGFGFQNQTGITELKWANTSKGNMTLEVEKDGEYFLYLQVALLSPMPGVNYTVQVEIYETKENAHKGILLTGYIRESQLSTGFLGKGFPSPSGRSLKVICMPLENLGNVDSENTYVGLIQLR